MSGSHITQPRDRLSKRYQDTHRALWLETLPKRLGPTKQARKAAKARDYRQRGGE